MEFCFDAHCAVKMWAIALMRLDQNKKKTEGRNAFPRDAIIYEKLGTAL